MVESRRRLDVINSSFRPVYVVWELTLECDHACRHCGSRAGNKREGELNEQEALAVVEQLSAMGTQEVVLIGGEAYLHDAFLSIVSAFKNRDINVGLTTGGLGVTQTLAKEMAKAGLRQMSVSIDGLGDTHDAIRSKRGSFDHALAALRHGKQAGLITSSNININRANLSDIEPLYETLKEAGVSGWQVQITSPLGRAADRPDLLLQPFDLIELVPRLADLKRRAYRDGITMMLGNNLGYFGPHEALLRSATESGRDHWQGCQAGRHVMGIESDGAVKGCPSLQTKHYVGGNLRQQSIQEIWDTAPELGFTRDRTSDDLWGYCKECVYADTCKAGCSFTAHALFDKTGNNPYCVFRAGEFKKEGLQERLVPTDPASGLPFDNGRFEIRVEPYGTTRNALPLNQLVRIGRKPISQGS